MLIGVLVVGIYQMATTIHFFCNMIFNMKIIKLLNKTWILSIFHINAIIQGQ